MSAPLTIFRAMLAKDLRRELRSKEIFISGFLLSIILLCVIYFSVTAGEIKYEKMSAGALWLCIVFTGTIGLNRIHQSEMANGCYRALIMAPVEGGWLFLAKSTANFCLLGGVVLLLLPLLWLFFHVGDGVAYGSLAGSLILGIAAFVAIGTLVVVIAASTRMKDVLFPMIQLPLVVPVLIAGVNSTAMALKGESAGEWLQFLAALNLVFIPAGFLLYEFLLEE